MNGHFDFVNLSSAGDEIGEPIHCKSDVGVLLQCHHKTVNKDVVHLCAIARLTPNRPVDLTAWTKKGELLWCGRIYWRN